MNILIVDDHPTNRKLLRVTLEAEGFTLLEAADGMEALELLERQPIEAVISDILMPRMDGFRFCQELRKHPRFGHLPVLIFSATYTSPDSEKLALDSGADRYLRKPCSTRDMVAAINSAARQAQRRRTQPDRPVPELQVMREYNETLIRKLEERGAELEQQREHLRIILASIGDAVIATDTGGQIIFHNPVAEALTGWSQEEALGQSILTVFHTINEVTAQPGEDIIVRVLREGRATSLANRTALLARNGRQIPIEDSAAPIKDSAGKVAGVVIVFHDVTEKRRVQHALLAARNELEARVQERTAELTKVNATLVAERRRFKDALDQLPAYVVLLSPDYHVPFANRFFEERFGKSEGRRCYEYLFQRTAPCETCETYTVLKTKAPHRWKWTGPDGHNYDIYDFPFTDTDGSPLIMEVGLDITEIKKAQAALKEANETLEQRVAERTAELRASNEETLRLNRAMVGRELRMIELKKEVNELCVKASLPPRYRLDFENEKPQ